jgi:hypothetical protein
MHLMSDAMLKRVNRHLFIQIFILSVGITMMTLGLLRGESLEILKKAIVICMECIGIG